MGGRKMSYYDEKCAVTKCVEGPERHVTSRERLWQKRSRLTEQLGEIDAALEALDANPEFERVHNLLSKVL
jgi:hypothetical protein